MPTTITVCTTCRQPALREAKAGDPCGETLLQALIEAAQAHADLRVRGAACLMGCEHGCNLALSAPSKMTYVLGRFEPTAEAAAAVVDYAALHAGSAAGVVPYRSWPQGVKGHFIARVPPEDPGPPAL
ncbi:MAG: DUF1636 domain-containing protein [Pseudomonadota bacterium]